METTQQKTLAETVRELREHRGWTQGQLATYAGCSQGFISAIESGERTKISAEYMDKLAKAFRVPVETLQGQATPSQQENALGWLDVNYPALADAVRRLMALPEPVQQSVVTRFDADLKLIEQMSSTTQEGASARQHGVSRRNRDRREDTPPPP